MRLLSTAALPAAWRRGWFTLEQLLELAAASPIEADVVAGLAREAGVRVVDGADDGWDAIGRLAEEGEGALRARPLAAAEPDDESLDAGAVYAREVGRIPLLSPEEEVVLARRVEAGRAAERALATQALDRGERLRRESAARAGRAARERLIVSNLRLVAHVARRFVGRGVPYLDLLQEGNIGLQRAVDKFEWRRGFKFSTYAHWWIRQAIGRAVADQARTIRLPVHAINQLTRLYNTAREIQEQLGRPARPAEIGERLGLTSEQVEEALRAARRPISLDRPIGEEERSTLAELIADAASTSPEGQAEATALSDAVDRMLREHLSPREADVLRLRFGLDRGGEERTLHEVGGLLGVSRERVRQIEAGAVARLRSVPQLRELAG
jgi:RNA polymerase primary sigma factor